MTSKREVYLISFKVPNGRDHWGLFFPRPSNPTKSKLLHVSGSPYAGFKHEVKHDWDMKFSKSYGFRTYLLGETDSANVIDQPQVDGSIYVTEDLNKADRFENLANRHPPPKVATEMIPKGTFRQVNHALREDIPGMKRCQEWTSELINDLVKEGVLPESALEVLDTARAERSMPPVARESVSQGTTSNW